MQNTYLNGVDIKIEPFDLTTTSETHKLDLLFYNNINRYGEILSSLVYISGIRLVSDKTLLVYNPNKLLRNTEFERSCSYTGTGNRWKNADLLTTGITNLKDNSVDATYEYDRFDVSTDDAVMYVNGDHSYDGWYTMYSLALRILPDIGSGVPIGTLRNNGGVIQYQSATDTWTNLTAIIKTIPIFNFMRVSGGDEYSYYDFVVTVKTNSMYKHLLDNKLGGDWFKRVNILNPKLRSLEMAIELQNYDKAQHIINAITTSLISITV